MARYAEKEALLLERIIMQEGLERTKAEDWARDEITRLSKELAAVTERMSKLDFERTAAELERDALREENARLREALQYIADPYNNGTTSKDRLAFLARKALGGGDG